MHPTIERADKPEDYDEILHHVSDEVKFHTGSVSSSSVYLGIRAYIMNAPFTFSVVLNFVVSARILYLDFTFKAQY